MERHLKKQHMKAMNNILIWLRSGNIQTFMGAEPQVWGNNVDRKNIKLNIVWIGPITCVQQSCFCIGDPHCQMNSNEDIQEEKTHNGPDTDRTNYDLARWQVRRTPWKPMNQNKGSCWQGNNGHKQCVIYESWWNNFGLICDPTVGEVSNYRNWKCESVWPWESFTDYITNNNLHWEHWPVVPLCKNVFRLIAAVHNISQYFYAP